MKHPWLITAILAITGSICVLTISHYFVCQVWINPQQLRLLERTGGKLPDPEHSSCKQPGPTALAALSSVLATLLALHSEPPQ